MLEKNYRYDRKDGGPRRKFTMWGKRLVLEVLPHLLRNKLIWCTYLGIFYSELGYRNSIKGGVHLFSSRVMEIRLNEGSQITRSRACGSYLTDK